MKTLPDEKTLLILLDDLKNAEQQAREICEMSTAIALKYQKRIEELTTSKTDKKQEYRS